MQAVRLKRPTDLEIAVQDVPRHQVLHTKRNLMNHSISVAPLAFWGLNEVDDVPVAHCAVSDSTRYESERLTVRGDQHPRRGASGTGRSIERQDMWAAETPPNVNLFDEELESASSD